MATRKGVPEVNRGNEGFDFVERATTATAHTNMAGYANKTDAR